MRGLRQASMSSASGVPSAGCWSYSHLAVRGSDMRIDSILPPVLKPKVVPRSYTCRKCLLLIPAFAWFSDLLALSWQKVAAGQLV